MPKSFMPRKVKKGVDDDDSIDEGEETVNQYEVMIFNEELPTPSEVVSVVEISDEAQEENKDHAYSLAQAETLMEVPTTQDEENPPNSGPSKPKVYICPYCKKEFYKQYTFNRHLPVHTDERKFRCNVCGKAFRQSSCLSRHKVVHNNKRPFQCERCEKAFSRISTLIAHRRTHEEKKTFECPHCGKGFHQKGNLKNHIFTHTGEKPYVCQVCGKSFNQMSNLTCHMSSKHSKQEEPANEGSISETTSSSDKHEIEAHTKPESEKTQSNPAENELRQLEKKQCNPGENKLRRIEKKQSNPAENELRRLEIKQCNPAENELRQLEEKQCDTAENELRQLYVMDSGKLKPVPGQFVTLSNGDKVILCPKSDNSQGTMNEEKVVSRTVLTPGTPSGVVERNLNDSAPKQRVLIVPSVEDLIIECHSSQELNELSSPSNASGVLQESVPEEPRLFPVPFDELEPRLTSFEVLQSVLEQTRRALKECVPTTGQVQETVSAPTPQSTLPLQRQSDASSLPMSGVELCPTDGETVSAQPTRTLQQSVSIISSEQVTESDSPARPPVILQNVSNLQPDTCTIEKDQESTLEPVPQDVPSQVQYVPIVLSSGLIQEIPLSAQTTVSSPYTVSSLPESEAIQAMVNVSEVNIPAQVQSVSTAPTTVCIPESPISAQTTVPLQYTVSSLPESKSIQAMANVPEQNFPTQGQGGFSTVPSSACVPENPSVQTTVPQITFTSLPNSGVEQATIYAQGQNFPTQIGTCMSTTSTGLVPENPTSAQTTVPQLTIPTLPNSEVEQAQTCAQGQNFPAQVVTSTTPSIGLVPEIASSTQTTVPIQFTVPTLPNIGVEQTTNSLEENPVQFQVSSIMPSEHENASTLSPSNPLQLTFTTVTQSGSEQKVSLQLTLPQMSMTGVTDINIPAEIIDSMCSMARSVIQGPNEITANTVEDISESGFAVESVTELMQEFSAPVDDHGENT